MALSWVIAGGGTGGHVTPALALGEAIAERGERVTFIGSERGLEAKLVPDAGFELVALGSQQVMGRSLLGRLRGVLGIVGQVGAARRALAARGADVVVSVGGYAAMPAAIAAILTRRPLVLVEPNAIPGRVNRLTARFARAVFVGFDRAARTLDRGHTTIHQTGIPLRRGLLEAFANAPERKPPEAPLHLFVFGGSQGARQINEAMMSLAPRLAPLPVVIFHQTGEPDRERVAAAYSKAGARAEVAAFEYDMPKRYRWADLAVCRAGALTVAELALAGLPALLIPYPFAADGHQKANAEALAEANAGRCLDAHPLDEQGLGDALTELFEQPEALARMSAAASALARPDAAREIIETTARMIAEERR
jgi:UDP-N-acetylglucosamine--N-acetylmuramyl-(pentapeptide) pyrophosphoryl-undecaprenol N-acetylglucosamine transferase